MKQYFKHIIINLVLINYATLLCSGQMVIDSTKGFVSSPDKKTVFAIYPKQNANGTRQLFYTVKYSDKEVINESVLDLQLDNHLSEEAMGLKVDKHANWCENLKVTGIHYSSKDTTWKPLYGESSSIQDHYNACVVATVKDDNPIYKLDIEVRVYNQGVAFRYYFPENEKGTYYNITAENTEFSLPANTKAWFTGWAQGAYELLPLENWPQESERPLTLQLSNRLYVCLAEAALTDYARTKFAISPAKANTIVTSMQGAAQLISPVASPWRAIMIAESPAALSMQNSLVLNLNEPNKLQNTDWIQPGKIMRVMTQTTTDAYANIDFAVKHHLQYILFDWKWYGPAFSFSSDATKVAIPDFNLPAIIQYGKERGIGVWLYVNQQALLAQSDSLFAVYNKWGVKGVKFGFVQVGSHRWTTWVEKTIQQAAASHIMVNIHDDWRPTGEQRTWPNLMTAEGIRGNEEMPDATHNTILPFTRYMCGPADYTICYYSNRIKTTHAHQLALAAIYYSPIQTLYWYDKPEMSNNEPELSFWDHIPTTWDETKMLDGKPGEFVTTARRSGEEWFIGTITNDQPRTTILSFNFLPKGRKYEAVIYSDDETAHTKTKVGIAKQTVEATTQLTISLKASGGAAIWINPIDVKPDFSLVNKKIQSWVDSGYYKGASVIIATNNQVLDKQYFGNYQPGTVAYIASAGKWLAAATIAAVVEEGKLNWNDKVKKWLPGFNDAKGEATLAQLLSHTAGFPDYQPKGVHPDNYQTLAESVAHIISLPADTLPGAVFKYGGLAMQVAGRMAELATGKDWETLFQEKITRPLNMQLTHFTPVDETPGHNPMLGGGARASLDDYAHFLSMILQEGIYQGKRILSKASIQQMQADHIGDAWVNAGEFVERARASKRKDIYGLGEWREEVNENKEATLISSPSWAGAYPWIDKQNHLYGFFLARVDNKRNGFNPFYASPILPVLVREALKSVNQ